VIRLALPCVFRCFLSFLLQMLLSALDTADLTRCSCAG
jgi:hypothetical protein